MELTESQIREIVRDEAKLILTETARRKMKILRQIIKALRRSKDITMERGQDNHDYVKNHDILSTKC